jgi:xanthine dehydrogenase accessory factor
MLNWVEVLKSYQDKQEAVALVTVIKCLGSTPCVVGSRMIVTKGKEIHGTIGGGKLEFQAIDEAIKAISENKIIEPMNRLPELFIFGAGHIGVEICKLLKDTPFKVTLIDSRKDWLKGLHFEEHVKTHSVKLNNFKTFKDAVRWGSNCYILVMTHDHTIDFDIIAMALQNDTKFLGLIGSKTKRVRFHNMLTNELLIKEGMDKVVCPIGLEVGGNSPKEIAISVVAQLLQVHYSE